MSDKIAENQKLLDRITTELNNYSDKTHLSSSEGGTEVTEAEKRSIQEYTDRISRIQATIDKLVAEDGKNNGSSSNTAIVYEDMKYKTWEWELIDKDQSVDDFGASLSIIFSFGKVTRGNNTYWILDSVTSSPQSCTGLKLEVTNLSSRYFFLQGNLVFDINLQFKLSTADVSVSTTKNAGISLGAEQKQEIGASLPNPSGVGELSAKQSAGVNAKLDISQQWVKSSVLPGSASTVTRIFLCKNKNGKLSIAKTGEFNPNVTGIDDPGMDGDWNDDGVGEADWAVSYNDNTFVGSI